MLVGVIGGMGPLASSLFMEMVTNHTKASKDQDHLNMIILSDASIPDRTLYILNESKDNPLPRLLDDTKKLVDLNCDFLVMTCNTAHYFYQELQKESPIPFINMIEETVKKTKELHGSNIKVGLMATKGTITTDVYKKVLEKYNMKQFIASAEIENKIMDFIYNDVKKGMITPKEKIEEIFTYFFDNGCDAIIMGCTELSVLMEKHKISDIRIIDSMRTLVEVTIEKAGKEYI